MQTITFSHTGSQNIQIEDNERVLFSFDVNEASYSRDGENNLIVELGESRLVLEDFFVTDGKELPEIELADGTVIEGQAFLQSMNPDMDLATAMGPTAAPDGGGTDYADGAGQLVEGIDRLGSGLGLGQWVRSLSRAEQDDSLTPPLGAAGPGGGEGPETGGDPLPYLTADRWIEHDTTLPLHLPHFDNVEWSPQSQSWVPEGGSNFAYHKGYIYDAGLVSEHIAGKGGSARVDLADSQSIQAGGGIPTGSDPMYVSGVFSYNGGTYEVTGKNVDISASASGIERGGDTPSTTVAGVWGHGSRNEDRESPYKRVYWEQSAVEVTAEEVTVGAQIIGNTEGFDTSNSTYIGAAASDGGLVKLTSTTGDITINVSNDAEGSAALSTSGVYGLFSGYGANSRDFENSLVPDDKADDIRDDYHQWLHDVFHDSRVLDDYYAMNGSALSSLPQSPNISLVDVRAEGDVNINVGLGEQDYQGAASGIKNYVGDVNVATERGDINISVTHDGVHSPQGANSTDYISAVEKNAGRIVLKAGDGQDISLNVESSGENIAALRYANGKYVEPLYNKGELWTNSAYYNPSFMAMSGAKISLESTSGKNGAQVYNSVAGIDADNGLAGTGHILSFKTENGDDAETNGVSIKATAYDNGQGASSTGISFASKGGERLVIYHDTEGNGESGGMTVAAEVVNGNNVGDSVAKGISIINSSLTLLSSDNGFSPTDGKDVPDRDMLYPINLGDKLDDKYYMDSLRVSAGGAKDNYGLFVLGKEAEAGGPPPQNNVYKLNIAAKKVDIEVTGREDDSTSYGIFVENGAPFAVGALIRSNDVSIKTHGADKSVGLHADGGVISLNENGTGPVDTPFSLEISCSLGDTPGVFDGIAIEALNEGRVSIASGDRASIVNINGHLEAKGGWIQLNAGVDDYKDDITINGNIIVKDSEGHSSGGAININTYAGDDILRLQGDILASQGDITIDAGNGNDIIRLQGDVLASDGSTVIITGGADNDIIHLNGSVTAKGSGEVYISGGPGEDILILEAPDAGTFKEWYGDWLKANIQSPELAFEGIVIKGAKEAEEGELNWLHELLRGNSTIRVQVDNSHDPLTDSDYEGFFDTVFNGSNDNPSVPQGGSQEDSPLGLLSQAPMETHAVPESAYAYYNADSSPVDETANLQNLLQILNT